MVPLIGDRTPKPVIEAPGNQFQGSLSPDGRWIAYTSTESGANNIYVQPFPPTGAKYQVSTILARSPLWSRDGRRLFFMESQGNVGRVMSVDVQTQPGFTLGTPTPVLSDVSSNAGAWPYDVMPDDQHIVAVLFDSDSAPRDASRAEIRVVLNWFEELKQRVPAP